jgi:hypothetical protein
VFIRFRQTTSRLQCSLVETRRVGGRVRHEHVAGLGSIEVPPSVRGRLEFWRRLHERLAKLGNRVDPATQAKVLGTIHARIPMVTLDEIEAAKLENAEADERLWSSLQGMHREQAEGQKQLAATAERAATAGEAAAAEAASKAAAAKERAERIKAGEDMPGGLGKPMTQEDIIEYLRKSGFTNADLERMRLLTTLSETELRNEPFPEVHKATDRAIDHATRSFVRRRSIKHMADAWREGVEARERGAAREELPKDYCEPTRKAEALAWLMGWDGEPLE